METKDNNINNKKNIFSRVMIKLSGEALLGNKEFGIDSDIVDKITSELNWGTDKLRDDITCLALDLENTEIIKLKK